jgi:fumarate reductase flavoprotein subunit
MGAGSMMVMARGLYSVGLALFQPSFMVNLLGERFIDEHVSGTTFYGMNVITRQKDGIAFNIFDEDTKNFYRDKGFEYGMGMPKITLTKAVNFDEEIEQVIESKVDGIYVADSIEELAEQLGINYDALKNTINEYNHGCDTGRDPHFNKAPRYLRPVRRPRFYAFMQTGRLNQWPGIKVNYRTEVITEDFETIPGFYGAGIDISPVLYYDIYPNILPGNAMGFAANSGRIAGENAAEYIKSVK